MEKHHTPLIAPAKRQQIMSIVQQKYWYLINSLCHKYESYFPRHHDLDDIIQDTYIGVCRNFFYHCNFRKVKDVPIVISCIIQQLHARFIKSNHIARTNFDNGIFSLEYNENFIEKIADSTPTPEDNFCERNYADLIIGFISDYQCRSFHTKIRNATLFLKYYFLSSIHVRKNSRIIEAISSVIAELDQANRSKLYRKLVCFGGNVRYVPRWFHSACDMFLVQLRKKIYMSGLLERERKN